MSTDFQNLKLRIATLHAEELLEMVTFDAADNRGEAVELARAELQKRGYSEADLQNWYDSAGDRPPKYAGNRFARTKFVLNLILTAIATFFLFTPLVYYSIGAYGIPATIFISIGYLIWLALRRSNPFQGRGFAIGFASSVSLVLMAYSIGLPWYTAAIVGQCLCLWILFQIIRPRA